MAHISRVKRTLTTRVTPFTRHELVWVRKAGVARVIRVRRAPASVTLAGWCGGKVPTGIGKGASGGTTTSGATTTCCPTTACCATPADRPSVAFTWTPDAVTAASRNATAGVAATAE